MVDEYGLSEDNVRRLWNLAGETINKILRQRNTTVSKEFAFEDLKLCVCLDTPYGINKVAHILENLKIYAGVPYVHHIAWMHNDTDFYYSMHAISRINRGEVPTDMEHVQTLPISECIDAMLTLLLLVHDIQTKYGCSETIIARNERRIIMLLKGEVDGASLGEETIQIPPARADNEHIFLPFLQETTVLALKELSDSSDQTRAFLRASAREATCFAKNIARYSNQECVRFVIEDLECSKSDVYFSAMKSGRYHVMETVFETGIELPSIGFILALYGYGGSTKALVTLLKHHVHTRIEKEKTPQNTSKECEKTFPIHETLIKKFLLNTEIDLPTATKFLKIFQEYGPLKHAEYENEETYYQSLQIAHGYLLKAFKRLDLFHSCVGTSESYPMLIEECLHDPSDDLFNLLRSIILSDDTGSVVHDLEDVYAKSITEAVNSSSDCLWKSLRFNVETHAELRSGLVEGLLGFLDGKIHGDQLDNSICPDKTRWVVCIGSRTLFFDKPVRTQRLITLLALTKIEIPGSDSIPITPHNYHWILPSTLKTAIFIMTACRGIPGNALEQVPNEILFLIMSHFGCSM